MSKDGRSVIFVTDHFSLSQVLGIDIPDAISRFKTDFVDGFDSGATASVSRPSCQGEAAARSGGFAISSSSTNTVYWCFGVSGSQRILKVTDDRRYPLQVFHPGLTIVQGGSIDWLQLSSLSHLGSGQSTIIAPSDTVTYALAVQPAGRAEIHTTMDGLGQSLAALQVAGDSLTSILTRFGAGSGNRRTHVLGDLLQIRSCADALGKGPGALIAGCFSPKDLLDAFGSKALLLAPVMAAGEVVGFLHGEWNALIDQFNNHDQYTIVISVPGSSGCASPGTSSAGCGNAKAYTEAQQAWKAALCDYSYRLDADLSHVAEILATAQPQYGGNPTAYKAAISELQSLAAIPATMLTSAQQAQANSLVPRLNAFFNTPSTSTCPIP